jgi:hypothetical protein
MAAQHRAKSAPILREIRIMPGRSALQGILHVPGGGVLQAKLRE